MEDTGRIATVLLAALLLDGVFADPPRLYRVVPHPIAVLGRGIDYLERRLNREGRTPAVLFLSGMAACLLAICLASFLGWLVARFCAWLPGGLLLEAVLASVFLAGRGLYDKVGACAAALAQSRAAGREALASLVGRDTRFLDSSGIIKAAIESLGENFSDAVVAPLFWGLLLGFPGLLAYKSINTLDSMLGYVSPRYFWFGKFAARIDDIVNFIPSRLSALVICLASLGLTGTSWRGACAAVARDARQHASWNAGWPESAFAGALGIAIAGPRRSIAGVHPAAWMGDGRKRLNPGDIRLALRLYFRACLLVAAILAAAALAAF